MRLTSFLTVGLAGLAASLPTTVDNGESLGLKFDKRDGELPTLKLPYATYRASEHDPNGDIYHFRNIRFAAPPTGDLRFAKPAPPQKEDEVQDGSYGPSCVQELPLDFMSLTEEGTPGIFIDLLNEVVSLPLKATSEDCLFLDLQVPGKAVRDPEGQNLPVVMWFYGGAYMFGSKAQLTGAVPELPVLPLYQGTGLIKESGGNMIFAASNYRLGAYGWLAGTTMENEATPNLGLHDQRAALQWIQDFVHLVGGDKTQVSAWGESAGAGSIYHHLASRGGTQDPLFTKAVVQSPAYEILFDREGQLEDTFQSFARIAGCPGGDMKCLRSIDEESMKKANAELIRSAPSGMFNVGPAADGDLIRQVAALEFVSGNYWKGLESIIISHTSNEAELFTTPTVKSDEDFVNFMHNFFPNYTLPVIPDTVCDAYPATDEEDSPYSTARDRMKAFIRDSSFTCYARTLTDAYNGNTWNMQYSATLGIHATDLLPLFLDDSVSLGDLNLHLFPLFGGAAGAYQSYMASYAVHGDPNTDRLKFNLPPTIEWPHPTREDDTYGNVVNVNEFGFFELIKDTQMAAESDAQCDFMMELAKALTNMGGYSPPGFNQSTIGPELTEKEATANF